MPEAYRALGPRLLSIATVLPEHVIRRDDTLAWLPALAGGRERAERFRHVVDSSRVDRRHVVLPPDELVRLDGAGGRADVYRTHARRMSEPVARRALEQADVDPATVEAVVTVSCTGYVQPSLDAHLIPALGLPPDARRVPITELGCAGGVAGVAVATKLVSPGKNALVVAVELCSLCIQVHEPNDGEIVGNLLFGDGAAAVVIGGDGETGPRVLASRTVLWPGTEDVLGMRLVDTGLSLVLSPQLPAVVDANLPETVAAFLAAQGVSERDVAFWVVHPGGPRVLEIVQDCLGLTSSALDASWAVWRECGNVSSTAVLFALETLSRTDAPRPGALGVVVAFGPGLSCELLLVSADGWLCGSSGD